MLFTVSRLPYNGSLYCWLREQIGAAGAGAGAGAGAKKRKVMDTMVDTTKLPPEPCVVPIDQVKFDTDSVAAVVRARAGLRTCAYVELDVSTNGKLQPIAIALATTFVRDHAQMANTCRQLAEIMGVNQTSALGANKAGAQTDRHQHAPMGVLNVATCKLSTSSRLSLVTASKAFSV